MRGVARILLIHVLLFHVVGPSCVWRRCRYHETVHDDAAMNPRSTEQRKALVSHASIAHLCPKCDCQIVVPNSR